MAEDVVDAAIPLAGLEPRDCVTRSLNIHGHHASAERFGPLAQYGSDAPEVDRVIRSSEGLTEPIHERLPARKGEVVWAAREEMARTVDDFLARRTRSLLLDARAAAEAAPEVARLLAAEFQRPPEWAEEQVAAFQSLAAGYVLD